MSTEEQEREKDLYRFSGYQFEKVTLDGTGPSYIIANPHPDLLHRRIRLWERIGLWPRRNLPS